MKLSALKNHLNTMESLQCILPDGSLIPQHFHITEAGLVTKHFVDCGGTVRSEKSINFQIWVANDTEHRLEPKKLLKIISLSENLFNGEDLEIEIEYQGETIGKYGVEFDNGNFVLQAKQTDCLAKDNCGVPQHAESVTQEKVLSDQSCCSPGGGCC